MDRGRGRRAAPSMPSGDCMFGATGSLKCKLQRRDFTISALNKVQALSDRVKLSIYQFGGKFN